MQTSSARDCCSGQYDIGDFRGLLLPKLSGWGNEPCSANGSMFPATLTAYVLFTRVWKCSVVMELKGDEWELLHNPLLVYWGDNRYLPVVCFFSG